MSIPHRYTVAPPDLAADAPITQIIYPVEINLFEPFRYDLDILFADDSLHHLLQALFLATSCWPFNHFFVDVYPPLQFDLWLDNTLTAFIPSDVMDVVVVYFDY